MTTPKATPMEVTKAAKPTPAAAGALTPMSDVGPNKPFDPAASLGVKAPNKKKQQISRKARMRKEKAADKGEAVRERLALRASKKGAQKEEKEKWKNLY